MVKCEAFVRCSVCGDEIEAWDEYSYIETTTGHVCIDCCLDECEDDVDDAYIERDFGSHFA